MVVRAICRFFCTANGAFICLIIYWLRRSSHHLVEFFFLGEREVAVTEAK